MTATTRSPATRIPAKAWSAPILGALDDAGRAAVEAACVLHRFSEGAHVARRGDPTDAVFVVVSGRVVTSCARGVTSSFGEGDLLGVEAVSGRIDREDDVIAAEGSVVGIVPQTVLRRALARSGASHLLGRTSFESAVGAPKEHVDARRVARSLLVLDPAACVSCGECARACASTHGGTPRLARRGERVETGETASLLALESCHHCTHPACLPACPTGAIVREPDGRVRIRESLCTGCEACAKACGWGNVRMRPRGGATVAAKCDLCEGRAAPACVAACPTEAIQRVDPATALGPARAAPRPTLGGEAVTRARFGRRAPVWPALVGALLAGAALLVGHASRRTSGIVLCGAFVVLVGLPVVRRIPRLAPSRGRAVYAGHLASGIVATFALVAHAGSASTFASVVAVALATGAVAALAYACVPRRLAQTSKAPILLEDAAAQLRRAEERVFELLSGRTAGVKALYTEVVRPYAHAPLGGLRTLLAGRSPEREKQHLLARARGLVGDRTHVLAQLEDLVEVAVDARGCRAAVVSPRLLRGVVLVHVVAAAIAVALAAMHVLQVFGAAA